MNKLAAATRYQPAEIDVAQATSYIQSVQRPWGEIPWSEGGFTDPWDHVESAMGLAVGGQAEAAQKAYEWLAESQMPDGSWWSQYRDGKKDDGAFKDTNMVTYIAVGLWHQFLCTDDLDFVRRMWPTVERAMAFAMTMREPHGAFYWAKRADGSIDESILLTGCSSIHKSLEAALALAGLLGLERPHWREAMDGLGRAIKKRPLVFDQSKARFSMDWYYPVLCGVITGSEAQRRLEQGWEIYVMKGWGARCVSDRPWVTMAETSELVMALAAMGNFLEAETLLRWIQDNRYDDGAYWTGLALPEREIYTREKTSWTGAAVLLAADMLYELSPACRLFSHQRA